MPNVHPGTVVIRDSHRGVNHRHKIVVEAVGSKTLFRYSSVEGRALAIEEARTRATNLSNSKGLRLVDTLADQERLSSRQLSLF